MVLKFYFEAESLLISLILIMHQLLERRTWNLTQDANTIKVYSFFLIPKGSIPRDFRIPHGYLWTIVITELKWGRKKLLLQRQM